MYLKQWARESVWLLGKLDQGHNISPGVVFYPVTLLWVPLIFPPSATIPLRSPKARGWCSVSHSFLKERADAQRRVMHSFWLIPKLGKHFKMLGKAGILWNEDLNFTLLEASQCISC